MRARSSPRRILAVDDDPGVLHAVKRVLAANYQLATTSVPTEALAIAAECEPDLAILDIRMPAMDGFELMERLRADHPDLDVIFVTGSMTDPDAHLIRAIQQGAFYFVQKPFDREVLRTLVERCLELRELRAFSNQELTKLRIAQNRLLPQVAPQHADYHIAFRYRPYFFATGDYHDFFPQPDGSLAVFVGDSSGHGPSACMLMATMRTLLATHPQIHGDPGQALSALTRLLHALIPSDLFMTAIYLLLRPGGHIDWAAAGQHPPIRVAASGAGVKTETAAIGLPLGIEAEERYITQSSRLGPGERLIVFTDGILEAANRDGKLFGLAGVQSTLASLSSPASTSDTLLDGLLDRVRAHLNGSDFEDDFTVLAVERRAN
jgi:serine phosphatase RsbU (regulator of sigma subunit)